MRFAFSGGIRVVTAIFVGLVISSQARAEQPAGDATLDRYVGYYQQGSDVIKIARSGDHLSAQGSDQPPIDILPTGPARFSAKQGSFLFQTDAQGNVTGAALEMGEHKSMLPRLSAEATEDLKRTEAANLAQRGPSPGVEDALKSQIAAFAAGQPDYQDMAAPLADAIRRNWTSAQGVFERFGSLKSLTFKSVMGSGANVFEAAYDNGQVEWVISPWITKERFAIWRSHPRDLDSVLLW